MLVEKKDTKELYALNSIRKKDIIEKDQIEHMKTERRILEYVRIFSFFKFINNIQIKTGSTSISCQLRIRLSNK